MKSALITGITGQDGYYLSKFLLNKNYQVYGMYRRSSAALEERTRDLDKRIKLVEGDLIDPLSMVRLIQETKPDEIYNLGAQSFVPSSWSQPLATADMTGLGPLNILESIRLLDKTIKFYQASTSEMFGKVKSSPQNEETPFHPRSPYGFSKVCAYWTTVNYRESYGIHASNGILFNHESPRRGKEFVTRKVTSSIADILSGKTDHLEIGNMDAKRDWGFAGDYVEAMWAMLQQPSSDDYVIATGETHSIREFIEESFKVLGQEIIWSGKEVNEIGQVNGKIVVKINQQFYRPAEVDLLRGDSSKAKRVFNWEAKTSFRQLVKIMMESDLNRVK